MSTIDDIAKRANVSHGTVSNVLNQKPGVSLDKIRRVEKAIQELGYTYNVQAKNLRVGQKMVILIIPSLKNSMYYDFYKSLKKELNREDFEIEAFETFDLICNEEEVLSRILRMNVNAIITISSMHNADQSIYMRFPCPVIFVNRPPQTRKYNFSFYSFNFSEIGQDIGSYLLKKRYKRLQIITSPGNNTDEAQIASTLKERLGDQINCSVMKRSISISFTQAFEVVSSCKADVIFVYDMLQADSILLAEQYLNAKNRPEIVCLDSCSIFSNRKATVFQLNYLKAGRKIADDLLEKLTQQKSLPVSCIFPEDFCRHFNNYTHIFRKEKRTITMLNLQSFSCDALKKLAPRLKEDTGICLEIMDVPHDSLRIQIEMMNHNFYSDLVRMDITWFTEMASDTYLPLSNYYQKLNSVPLESFKDKYHDYIYVGNQAYAIPFDPSALILLYRRDLFEDPILKREYFEKYHQVLEIPKDFSSFNNVAAFFTRSVNKDSPVPYGTVVSAGASSLAINEFMQRWLSLNPHFFRNGRIAINTPEAYEALTNCLETCKYAPTYDISWWTHTVRELVEGNCAMVIVFSNLASYIQDINLSKLAGKISSSVVPGGRPVLGGGLIGVSKYSDNIDTCCDFLNWYYSDEIVSEIVALGGVTPRTEIYHDFDFSLYPWLSERSNAFDRGIRNLVSPTIPGFPLRKFEYILGSVVRNCMNGTMSVKEALSYSQQVMDKLFGDITAKSER